MNFVYLQQNKSINFGAMAKIYKAEDVFKPLTAEQKAIADKRYEKLVKFMKGKIIVKDDSIFNLGLK